MKEYATLALILGTAAFSIGCSRQDGMANVRGKVTLDGKPLKGAFVVFEPQDGSRESMGLTDDSGVYTLDYSTTVSGAKIGQHRVRITTFSEAFEDEETGEVSPGKPETLPANYNLESSLTATVSEGSNKIDFVLDSEGVIADYQESPIAEDPDEGLEDEAMKDEDMQDSESAPEEPSESDTLERPTSDAPEVELNAPDLPTDPVDDSSS